MPTLQSDLDIGVPTHEARDRPRAAVWIWAHCTSAGCQAGSTQDLLWEATRQGHPGWAQLRLPSLKALRKRQREPGITSTEGSLVSPSGELGGHVWGQCQFL